MVRATKRDLETVLDRRWRLEHCYRIRGEDKKLKQLRFNPTQEILFNGAKQKNFRQIREFDLKGRKLGVSTFWLLFYLDDTIWVPNTTTGIIAHKKDDVQKLFRIVKLAYRTCPDVLVFESGVEWHKPAANYDNKNELVFDEINSKIYVALESRGDTNNNLHISEAAFIKNADTIKASLASVPNIKFGTNITIESTANGMGDWFQETYTEAEIGQNQYMARFFPWFIDPKHTIDPPDSFELTKEEEELKDNVRDLTGVILSDAKMYWYRLTRQEQKKLMPQEFPTFSSEAFLFAGNLTFNEEAVRAIKTKKPIRILNIDIDTQDFNNKQIKRKFGVSIWAEPVKGRRYVLAVDPSEGLGGDSDNCAIEVYDCVTLEQVAEYVSNEIGQGDAAKLVDKLARFFNMALVVPENNFGQLLIDRLKQIYPRIYFNHILDEKQNRKTKKLGFNTSGVTRDLILDEFEDLVDTGSVGINSAILKAELMVFVTDENGRRQAKQGKKDDTILASAIALKIARMPRTAVGVFMVN